MAEDYLRDYDWEYIYNGTSSRYIYDIEKTKRNWKKIKENIDNGITKPIEFEITKDGFEIPYGKDCFLKTGELMPDGVADYNSIFYRDNKNGDFFWNGNYYSLKGPGYGKKLKSPIATYERESEKDSLLAKEFGKLIYKSTFIKDNNTQIN